MAAQPTARFFSQARPHRTVPASWRILVLALVIGLLAQLSTFTLPILAMLGILGVWRSLAPQASDQVADPTLSRVGKKTNWSTFIATLATLASFLIFALEPVEHWLRDSEHRQAIVSLTAVTMLLALTFGMSAQGWSFGAALLTGLAAFGALAAAVWYATTESAVEAHWATTFLRLALVVGVAELLTPVLHRARRWRLKLSWEGLLRTGTLLLMLALMLQAPGAVRNDAVNPTWWIGVSVLGALAVAWMVWQARLPALMDWRWWTKERKFKPMPTPLAVSFGFVPAVGAAPLANWPVWLVAFMLGVLAAGLVRVGAPRN